VNSEDVVLQVQNLKKVYKPSWFTRLVYKQKPFTAVDGISFSLQEGEILGFLGPNGAGKTTTIQMLLSTLTPTAGSIIYYGKDFFTHRSEILQHVGFASTYVSLPRRLTVYENLEVWGRLYAMPYRKRKEKIKEILHDFMLWDLRHREVGRLSAGQTSRVMLAKAFLVEPKVALLDEPTAALDPDMAQEIRHYIFSQQERYKISILFASHNMYEVTEVCDRVIVLQKGKIIASDTPENLASQISRSRLLLMVDDDLEKLVQYTEQKSLVCVVKGNYVEIEIEESEIAKFLTGIVKEDIEYTNISIKNP